MKLERRKREDGRNGSEVSTIPKRKRKGVSTLDKFFKSVEKQVGAIYTKPKRNELRFPKLPEGFKAKLYTKKKVAMRKMMQLEELNEDPIAPDLRTFPELEHDWLSNLWRVSWWEPSERLRRKIAKEEAGL